MDKVWLKSYPPGVPRDIDPDQYRSLGHLLEDAFRRHAGRRAFVCMDRFLTYAELDSLSKKLGAWLQSRGLRKNARVAVMLPNVLQYPIAIAAILRAGYIVVNVDPRYTPRELVHQLNDSGSEAIVILENCASALEQVLPKTAVRHIVVASMGDMLGVPRGALVNFVARRVKKMVPAFSLPNALRFGDALSAGGAMKLTAVDLAGADTAFLQYTDNTAGVTKGAMLSHRNLVANIVQGEAWAKPGLERAPVVESLSIVCALPLHHIFALTTCALWGMHVGALNILIPNPDDIGGFVRELGKHRFNLLPAQNALYHALLNHSDFAKLDFSGLKICNGGTAVETAVGAKWLAITGVAIIEGYGLPETTAVVSCNRADSTAFTGNSGLPLPSTEVALLDDDGVPVAIGETGEIAIRGPQVMAGYWSRPDETARVMTDDGYFKSGAMGVMDAGGYLHIARRKSDDSIAIN
jgi:long-chain acyl-CoA synthetase